MRFRLSTESQRNSINVIHKCIVRFHLAGLSKDEFRPSVVNHCIQTVGDVCYEYSVGYQDTNQNNCLRLNLSVSLSIQKQNRFEANVTKQLARLLSACLIFE